MNQVAPSGATGSIEWTADAATSTITFLFQGEFDLTNKEMLVEALSLAFKYERVTLDFSKTTYIDSTAVNAILSLKRRLPSTNQLQAIIGSTGMSRVFDITGLSKVLTIVKAGRNAVAQAAEAMHTS